jgi:hypothetical protein
MPGPGNASPGPSIEGVDMGRWWGRREPAPTDVAERLTRAGLFRVRTERVPLTDVETVRRWLRELGGDHQVHVRRPWGAIAAVGDRRLPAGVVMADTEDRSWGAYPPGGAEDSQLTPDQVEHIMVDALTSTERPAWPEWRRLD